MTVPDLACAPRSTGARIVQHAEIVVAALDAEDRFVKSTGTRAVTAVGLIGISVIVGVLAVELFCHFFVRSVGRDSVYDWNRRIMFVDGAGSIFENHGKLFTYVPHDDVRSLTVYYSDNDFNIEYDYEFHTNNYGLVQDADVIAARPSLLLLGDSFTEGQGAEPWFRRLAAQTDQLPYQLINGGLPGTGFEQWSKLEQYLSEDNVKIRKLLVLFISDDFLRTVWNFDVRCLESLSACRGDELYARLPPFSKLPLWIDKIRTYRASQVKRRIEQEIRRVLPASSQVYDYLSTQLSSRAETAEQHSRAAIADFIEKYGSENVAFMHLPQKDETSGPTKLGMDARRAIRDAGGKLYDGFTLCHLSAADYHIHDGHPNAQGYGKIADCVHNVIQQMTAKDIMSGNAE